MIISQGLMEALCEMLAMSNESPRGVFKGAEACVLTRWGWAWFIYGETI